MKATVTAGALAASTGWVSRIVPARPPVPVLGGVVIDATTDEDRDEVTLSAFDYEIRGSAALDAGVLTVDEPGRVVVSGRLLATLAKTIGTGDQPVVLATDGEGRVSITAGRSRWVMPELKVEDYPQVPGMPPAVGELPAAALAAAVGAVADACDEKREVGMEALTGMAVLGDQEQLTLVGTNRYTLSICETPWTAADGLEQLLAPAALMRFAATAVAGDEGAVTVHAGDGSLGFSTATRSVSGRLLGVEFVRWRQLDVTPEQSPARFAAHAVVTAEQMRAALSRAAVMLAGDRSWVRMDFSTDGIEVTAAMDDIGEAEHVASVEAYEGDPMAVQAKVEYLRDALDGSCAWGADRVRIDLTSASKPILIRPAGGDGEVLPGYRHTVMPVKLGQGERAAA